jgi:hypothetical protein
VELGETGLEHPTKSPIKPPFSKQGVTDSVTQSDDLAKIADAWPSLTPAIKTEILAIVKAALEAGGDKP